MKAAVFIGSLSLVIAVFALFRGVRTETPSSATDEDRSGDIARIEKSIQSLSGQVASLKSALGTLERGPDGKAADTLSVEDRFVALETALARLQTSFDTVRLEPPTEEIAALFLAEDGVEKADAYFEAGKFTIAADGYMKFLEKYPDHPDAKDILSKARKAYQRAGYSDMAIWVQGESMRLFPETRAADLMTLASMEKLAGRYDDAVAHSTEAADLATNRQTEMWNRMYAAWYTQLRDGDAAGLQAYLQVQQQIHAAGLGDGKMGAKVQDHIDALRGQLAGGR